MTRLNWAVPVGSLLHTLQKHDIALTSVFDGEEDVKLHNPFQHTRRKEASEIITSVDESWLYVASGAQYGWVYLVLDNDPDEIAADWCASGRLMAMLQTAIDEYNKRWEGRKCPTTAEAE